MDWAWTKAEWKDNDEPFASIRENVNQMAIQKKLTEAKLAEWQKLAEDDPLEPKAQFRWAFGCYRLELSDSTEGKWLGGAIEALAQARRYPQVDREVRSYNFCRLRFLLVGKLYGFHQLVSAGERLLEKNPRDFFVKFQLASLLYFDDPKEGPTQRKLVEELIQERPNDPAPHALKALTIYRKWIAVPHLRSEATQARAAYNALAKRFPEMNSLRDQQLAHIKRIQTRAEEYDPSLARR